MRLNFSHLQSTLHLMQYTYWDFFCTAQNSVWTCLFWCLFSASAVFSFTSSTSATCFPLRTFFIWKGKKSCLGWDHVNREGGAQGSSHFWQKNCWTLSVVWSGTLVSHPSWNGQTLWKSFQKKIHWNQVQPLTTTPAGALTEMGSWNTHLAQEVCTTRGPPSRR